MATRRTSVVPSTSTPATVMPICPEIALMRLGTGTRYTLVVPVTSIAAVSSTLVGFSPSASVKVTVLVVPSQVSPALEKSSSMMTSSWLPAAPMTTPSPVTYSPTTWQAITL